MSFGSNKTFFRCNYGEEARNILVFVMPLDSAAAIPLSSLEADGEIELRVMYLAL